MGIKIALHGVELDKLLWHSRLIQASYVINNTYLLALTDPSWPTAASLFKTALKSVISQANIPYHLPNIYILTISHTSSFATPHMNLPSRSNNPKRCISIK